jgi:hypothetical protein
MMKTSEATMVKEILYKNLSSIDRKRRLFSSCVVNEADNLIITTERKYVYLVKKTLESAKEEIPTHVFIRRARSDKSHVRHFSCVLKGGFYVNTPFAQYLIRYAHCLRIAYQTRS